MSIKDFHPIIIPLPYDEKEKSPLVGKIAEVYCSTLEAEILVEHLCKLQDFMSIANDIRNRPADLSIDDFLSGIQSLKRDPL